MLEVFCFSHFILKTRHLTLLQLKVGPHSPMEATQLSLNPLEDNLPSMLEVKHPNRIMMEDCKLSHLTSEEHHWTHLLTMECFLSHLQMEVSLSSPPEVKCPSHLKLEVHYSSHPNLEQCRSCSALEDIRLDTLMLEDSLCSPPEASCLGLILLEANFPASPLPEIKLPSHIPPEVGLSSLPETYPFSLLEVIPSSLLDI